MEAAKSLGGSFKLVDGNVSNVGDDSSEDGDAADTQSDNDTETETEEHTEESTDESEGMDADDDDGASADSSGTDTSGRTNPLVWSSVCKAVGLPQPFTADHGPLVLFPGDARPADYFGLLLGLG